MIVYLLGQKTQCTRQLTQWLETEGYEVVLTHEPKGVDMQRAQLIIHCAEQRSRAEVVLNHHHFLIQLQKSHPFFPVLQVLARRWQKSHQLHWDCHHEACGTSVDGVSFLKMVKRLLYVGVLRHRLAAVDFLDDHFSHHLDQLDLSQRLEVQTRLLHLLADLTQCENALYFPIAALQALSGHPQSLADEPCFFRPLSPEIDLESLTTELKNAIDSATKPVSRRISQVAVTLIPIHNELDGRALGGFVLIAPQVIPLQFAKVLSTVKKQLSVAQSFDTIRHMTYIDDVTLLFNQRYLSLVLDQEIGRARRYGQNFSVLFIDVDYFKSVNDLNGHVVGSAVLAQIAKLIRSCTRKYDSVFRYGGDEFVVVLPNAGVVDAHEIGERIRSQVELATFVIGEKQVRTTVSIGIATFPDHATNAEQVLQLADQAMYTGKNSSRNLVYVAS